ncbi:helix-turn-helix domain-containing protein [Celeribacter sp. SCSIO 80788]|uniref:helix-turn-helix domain-containing protein n=1 Tax=Celeribacter sp. SCSIO 80788 TaxID=3117013 RepID=UPI003DA4B40B
MKNLRQYLIDRGETQEAFARRINTSQANVSKLCGDSPKIGPAMAARIAKATFGEVPITAWPQFKDFEDVIHGLSEAEKIAREAS